MNAEAKGRITSEAVERMLSGLNLQSAIQEEEQVVPAHRAFREAAAVLSTYDPAWLRPAEPRFSEDSAVTWLLPDSMRVFDAQDQPRWCLTEDIRRRTLKRLGSRDALLQALKANPTRPDDPAQKAFESLVRGKAVDMDALSPQDLAGYLTAVEWLQGILPSLPDPAELRRRAGLTKLLAPLRRLVGTDFEGREGTLKQMRDYVGVLPPQGGTETAVRFLRRLRHNLLDFPPLFIYGPGGVGKSTLIAKFVLDHAAVREQDRFPFVYLDIDRSVLVPEEPLTLLQEAVRQIAIQYPAVNDEAERLIEAIGEGMAKGATVLEAVSAGPDRTGLFAWFARLVQAAEPRERPVLFVLDTFEEVQYLGDDLVEIVMQAVNDLQRVLPRLCVIVAGRAKPSKDVRAEPIHLEEFDQVSGRAFVGKLLRREKFHPTSEEITELMDLVGLNPLSLKLAVGVLVQEERRERGAGTADRALVGINTRRFLLLRVKAAQVQAQLYGRILDHVHDKEVARIAYPGLVLRRITPEIIQEVLAGPCNVEIRDRRHAEELFKKLAREASLVEWKDEALEHRKDVRRLMLTDLRNQFRPETEAIHRKAIEYFSSRPATDLEARAEEIYHRLCLAQGANEIDPRWLSGVENYLRDVLEELEAVPRRYLEKRLGVTPNHDVLARADLEEWEAAAALRARRRIDIGDLAGALVILRERKERTDGSPLFSLESEALRVMGRRVESMDTAQRGLKAASRAGRLGDAAELLLIFTLAAEAEGRLDEALVTATEAQEAAKNAKAESTCLRAALAELRLLRKIGKADPGRVSRLRAGAFELFQRSSERDLRQHSSLLRDMAVELGSEHPEILREALRVTGLRALDTAGETGLAQDLSEWDAALVPPGGLASAAGLDKGPAPAEVWRKWLREQGLTRLGRELAGLLDRISAPLPLGMLKALTRLLSADAEQPQPQRRETSA
jgi:cellulose synthase operon protein C